MRLAERYARWLEGSFVAEAPPLRVARELPNEELQALWFAGEFGREFTTTTGGPVRIERFGAWNAGAGPHFTGVQIAFGDARVRGGVAVHWNAGDWDREAAASPEYEGTILHVFAREVSRERGEAVPASCTALGREVPQVWLDTTRYAYLPAPARPDAPAVCRETLAALPEAQVLELAEAAAQYRLCRKAARLDRWRAEAGPDEALYRAVAEALGYRANKLPMLLLSQRFPLELLRAQRTEIEPLLFAGSGFLNATDFHALPSDTRGYLQGIWQRWWPRRTEFERLSVPRALWNPRGVRPVNHPQRRVAALAEIARNWPVLAALARSANVKGLIHFFGQLSHAYWDRHYTLTSQRSASRMALVGETRAADLLVNVFFPAALAASPDFWEDYRNLPAPDSNRRVENTARRLFGPGPLARRLSAMAMTQQGLLQLDEDFCAACEGDCVRCALPERLDRWNDGL